MRRFSNPWGLRRVLLRETRGTEIAEAAAVLPILFMIILGIFWCGQAFSTYGTITRAAQEGARAAVAPACSTCAGTTGGASAVSVIQNVLTIAKLDPNQIQGPPTAVAGLLSCRTGSAVSCDALSPSNVCVQESVQLSVRAAGGVGVCGTVVNFQYPFSFYLPFTSLNKRKILLNAQARVRLETH